MRLTGLAGRKIDHTWSLSPLAITIFLLVSLPRCCSYTLSTTNRPLRVGYRHLPRSAWSLPQPGIAPPTRNHPSQVQVVTRGNAILRAETAATADGRMSAAPHSQKSDQVADLVDTSPVSPFVACSEECILAVDGAEYCVPDPYPTGTPASTSSATVKLQDAEGDRSLYVMMGLCFLIALVCALDRVAMSVAIVPMAQVYEYSETTKGLIISVFSWGYMASMLPSSVFIGVIGPKATMAAGVLAWSLAQMLSPAAASTSLSVLLVCRFVMGIGEAVTLPSIQAIVADRVPQDQRNRWLSLIISGLQVGTVLAYLASPPIISYWNWQGIFLSYGALGLAWLALWLPLMSDGVPATSPVKNLEARPFDGRTETIVGDDSKRKSHGGIIDEFRDVPWKQYVTNGQIWAISSAHMAHNWGLYVMLAWLPTYFNQEFHLSLSQSSGASVVPWVAGAVTGNVAGWAADALVNREVLSLRAVRRVFQTIALAGPAMCMLALSAEPETAGDASSIFTVAVALGSCSSAGFGSSVQDLRSRHTGVIYGLTSACSAVVGSVGTYLTGIVLDATGSWSSVFQITAVVYLMGAVLYGLIYRAEPLELSTTKKW